MKDDIKYLCKQFENIIIEENEECLAYIKDQEESFIEKVLKKLMEQLFSTLFEDVRHERSLIILLSLTDPDILRQSKFTDGEVENIKNISPEKFHRERMIKEHVAMDLLEKQFSN